MNAIVSYESSDIEIDASRWKVALDKSSGEYYYYHRITRETTWDKPLCLQLKEDADSKNQNTIIFNPSVSETSVTNSQMTDIQIIHDLISELLKSNSDQYKYKLSKLSGHLNKFSCISMCVSIPLVDALVKLLVQDQLDIFERIFSLHIIITIATCTSKSGILKRFFKRLFKFKVSVFLRLTNSCGPQIC